MLASANNLDFILRTMGYHWRGVSAPDKVQFMSLKGHSSFLCRMNHIEAREPEMRPGKRWEAWTTVGEWTWGEEKDLNLLWRQKQQDYGGPRDGGGQRDHISIHEDKCVF